MNSHKESVRKAVRRQRKQLEKENKRQMDEKILEQVLALPEIDQAELVYAYASIDGEVDTYELIRRLWIKQIRVALPKVEGKEVFFYIVDNFEELISGSYGIFRKYDFSVSSGVFKTDGRFDRRRLMLHVYPVCPDFYADERSGDF